MDYDDLEAGIHHGRLDSQNSRSSDDVYFVCIGQRMTRHDFLAMLSQLDCNITEHHNTSVGLQSLKPFMVTYCDILQDISKAGASSTCMKQEVDLTSMSCTDVNNLEGGSVHLPENLQKNITNLQKVP